MPGKIESAERLSGVKLEWHLRAGGVLAPGHAASLPLLPLVLFGSIFASLRWLRLGLVHCGAAVQTSIICYDGSYLIAFHPPSVHSQSAITCPLCSVQPTLCHARHFHVHTECTIPRCRPWGSASQLCSLRTHNARSLRSMFPALGENVAAVITVQPLSVSCRRLQNAALLCGGVSLSSAPCLASCLGASTSTCPSLLSGSSDRGHWTAPLRHFVLLGN